MEKRKMGPLQKATCICTAYQIEWQCIREKRWQARIKKLCGDSPSTAARLEKSCRKLRTMEAYTAFLETKYACLSEGAENPTLLAI